MFTTG